MRLASRRNLVNYAWLVGFLLMCVAAQSLGQGCAQCLDATRATPAKVQAGYRHAIYVLGGAGALLFVGGLSLLRREP